MKHPEPSAIAALCRAKGVSRKELAGELDVNRCYLSQVEHGHKESKPLVRRAVALLSQKRDAKQK
tara:strand:- start:917 stop:1111 length:195 start_codon:yes stop_codon:yes gene_type:complete